MAYAIQCGLKVIACIGEKINEREAGQTEEVVKTQLKAISGRHCRVVYSAHLEHLSKISTDSDHIV